MIENTELLEHIAKSRKNSADAYEAIKVFTSTAMNSLSPGSWLADACLAGDYCGPDSEAAESARAIRDSYQFGPRTRMLKFPGLIGPRDKDGEELFLCIPALETRSLVYKISDGPIEQSSCVFRGGRVEGEIAHQPKKKAGERKQAKARQYTYELVERKDLDAVYNSYILPDGLVTVDEVMQKVWHFVRRKFAIGIEEWTLRERGLDDLISQVMLKLRPQVEGKRVVQTNGVGFSQYVNRTWSNQRTEAYRELTEHDALFVPNEGKRKGSADSGISGVVSKEDGYAATLDSSSAMFDASKAQQILSNVSLTRQQKDIANLFMSGHSQKDVAEQVDMSRHQVYRVMKQIEKKIVRASGSPTKGRAA